MTLSPSAILGPENDVKVALVTVKRAVMSATGLCDGCQRRVVERGEQGLSAVVAQRATAPIGYRRPGRRADTEYGNVVSGCAQAPGCAGRLIALDAVGNEDDLTALDLGLLQQLLCLEQTEVGAAALGRHDGWIQGPQLGPDGVCIPGQRRDRKGVAGEYDETCLAFRVVREYVFDLEAGAHQARGLQVWREHGTRKVEHDDA